MRPIDFYNFIRPTPANFYTSKKYFTRPISFYAFNQAFISNLFILFIDSTDGQERQIQHALTYICFDCGVWLVFIHVI